MWFGSPDTGLIADVAAAAVLNGSMLIQDTSTGRYRSFDSRPSVDYQFPLYMRVYFADTAGDIPSSTTYCLQQAQVSCYVSGVLQSGAGLSLSGMTKYQIRYYPFTVAPGSSGAFYGASQIGSL